VVGGGCRKREIEGQDKDKVSAPEEKTGSWKLNVIPRKERGMIDTVNAVGGTGK